MTIAHPIAQRAEAPPDAAEPVLLILADISGYTRFMTANAKTLAHSQVVITELIKAIIAQIELPLEVAKLEGDAVFLFCRKRNGARPWPETKRLIGEKLLAFFWIFSEKVAELSRSTTCSCHACANIEKLRLKVVVHSGEALFHRVLNFVELAGVDVIIAHRLLKNSVATDQYLLLTGAAREDVEFPENLPLIPSAETYEDLGRINTLVYLPDGDRGAGSRQTSPASPPADAFAARFARSWRLFFKLWLGSVSRLRTKRNEFHHVTSSGGAAGRIAFAALMLLLAPIYLPVGTIFVLMHARSADR